MKQYILYDGRARTGNTDAATVLATAETEEEARALIRADWAGEDVVWFEYDVAKGDVLNRETLRDDLR